MTTLANKTRVRLTRDTSVRHKAGEILEVTAEEGRRLIAFGLAKEEPKRKKKKTED